MVELLGSEWLSRQKLENVVRTQTVTGKTTAALFSVVQVWTQPHHGHSRALTAGACDQSPSFLVLRLALDSNSLSLQP